jgi:hypothetical protein
MSKQFELLVNEALDAERELRALTPGRPSLRCYIATCLERADATYADVEAVKERLADPQFGVHSGCATFIRDLSKQIAAGKFPAPPEKRRVGALYFNWKDQAIMELGGQPSDLFLLWVVAAEVAYQQQPAVFGRVEDLTAHKARILELESKVKDLYSRFPSTWKHDDLHIGKITSDGAALITFVKAAGEVPVHHPRDAGERLVDWLLRQEEKKGKEAKAA